MRAANLLPVLMLSLAGCSQGTGRPDGPDGAGGGGGGGGPVTVDDSECAPERVGMAAAQRVRIWQAPEGCTTAAGGDVTLHTEEELRAYYTCPPGIASGIDFARDQLVIMQRMLSPAQVGTDLYDDGTKITFVRRERTPCPDDPRPMPVTLPLGFLVPAGAQRTYAEARCTVRSACN